MMTVAALDDDFLDVVMMMSPAVVMPAVLLNDHLRVSLRHAGGARQSHTDSGDSRESD